MGSADGTIFGIEGREGVIGVDVAKEGGRESQHRFDPLCILQTRFPPHPQSI